MGTNSLQLTNVASDGPTRREVATQLGCSVSTVRRLEFVELNPIADDRGVVRYDPIEVAALAGKRGPQPSRAPRRRESEDGKRGRLAARVFTMFAEGRSLRHIVVRARVAPELVRSLYHEWQISLQEGEWVRLDRESRQ